MGRGNSYLLIGYSVSMCRRCGCQKRTADREPRAAPVQGSLEAAVLIACADAPRYGYEIAAWLTAEGLVSGPVSPGRLYETLAALAQAGAIVARDEPSGIGPNRRRYHLTEVGWRRLSAWAVTLEQTGMVLARVLARLVKLDRTPYSVDSPAANSTSGGDDMPCQCQCGGPKAAGSNRAETDSQTAVAGQPAPAPARSVEARLDTIESLLQQLTSR